MIRIGIELIALGKLRSGSLVSAAVVPTSSTPTKAKLQSGNQPRSHAHLLGRNRHLPKDE